MAADTLPSDCEAALLAVQGGHVVRGKYTSPGLQPRLPSRRASLARLYYLFSSGVLRPSLNWTQLRSRHAAHLAVSPAYQARNYTYLLF